MTGGSLVWLAGTMAVFVAANVGLRTYVVSNALLTLFAALCLFCVGNLMMVRLMRESGLAVAVSVAAIVQLVLLAAVAVLWFDERPTMLQFAGMALGLVAVALIAWPQGGRG